MKTSKILQLMVVVAGIAVASACHDGSDDVMNPPAGNNTVPNSAGASSASFVAYLKTLPAADETSEPLAINSDFAAPAEDDAEPIAL